jgi:NADPH:quinone reductase-like Zn-dependent oxidoreductase
MRAAVVTRFGPPEVVEVREVPRPRPGAKDVLVRVRTAAVTSGDARIRSASFPAGFWVARPFVGLRSPWRPVLGIALSGVVEEVGSGVTRFAPGDEVCGMAGMRMGAHAELAVVPASRLVVKPPEVGHDEAAALLFGGTTALPYLRDKGRLTAGASVLVNGASGAVGSSAVQVAKHLGAVVTGVTSTPNVGLVTKLGADRVVDYTREDLLASPERYDVVLDTVGNLTLASGRSLLAPGGRLLLVVATLGQTLRARGDAAAGPAPSRAADVEELLRMASSGALVAPVDSVHDLDGIVEAHRRVDTGHKVGNVLVHP